jgi:hypothetical protein
MVRRKDTQRERGAIRQTILELRSRSVSIFVVLYAYERARSGKCGCGDGAETAR